MGIQPQSGGSYRRQRADLSTPAANRQRLCLGIAAAIQGPALDRGDGGISADLRRLGAGGDGGFTDSVSI